MLFRSSCLVVFSVFIMSSAFSPLATILTQNKLTGNNFIDWKRNLDIILIMEDQVYVLTTPYPEEPTAGATAAARCEFEKWRKSNGMARCYMLASMAGVLQHQFQSNDSASAIMTSLKEIFGEHGKPAKQIAMKKIMNAKMMEGTLVREYALKMISFLNELKTLGANIDAQTQVDMILSSLLQ